jgi:hypothetical protein
MDHGRVGLVVLGLAGVALASPVLTKHVGLLGRDASIAVGSAVAGGAVIAYAVLEAEARADQRRRKQAEDRDRAARASKVWSNVVYTPTVAPNDDENILVEYLVGNDSGHRITNVEVRHVRAHWTREHQEVLAILKEDFVDPRSEPWRLNVTVSGLPFGPDEWTLETALLTYTDFDGHRIRRWPDGSIDIDYEPPEAARI